MFDTIVPRGVDQLMALTQAFRKDDRTQKVDLIVGVYKDDTGGVPIMSAVKKAEAHLVAAETTKNYVGVIGDAEVNRIAPQLVLGENAPAIMDKRIGAVQTPGGSGALKVGFDLINSIRPGAKVWMSRPTWANHMPIARDAGMQIDSYPYFRESDRGLDFEAMMAHLDAEAVAGDVILLHACCHNPTGVDLAMPHWEALCKLIVARGLVPFVDSAYQGLGTSMEEDVAGLRHLAEHVPEMLIASSFSKNFGIYRERCGALTVIAKDEDSVPLIMAALQSVIRSNYSMPPSHGARIVGTVFGDAALKAEWAEELEVMRQRIAETRVLLRAKMEELQVTSDLSFLTDQRGMFSYTGFTSDQVNRLRDEVGVYTAGDGRINVAGVGSENIDYVASSFAAVMRSEH